jgi:CRISPR-associated protein Csd1
MLDAILSYVKAGTILNDLSGCEVIALDESGAPDDDKALVRWRVVGLEGEESACWKNHDLIQAAINWIVDEMKSEPQDYDMILGEYGVTSDNHPKNILPYSANSKLISGNDKYGLVYRGRFMSRGEAISVGYVSSQKAHCALRWLVGECGITYGKKNPRTLIYWSPDGSELPSPTGVFATLADDKDAPGPKTQDEFRRALRSTAFSFENKIKDKSENVAIAILQPLSKGRMSLGYYAELSIEDYLQRLARWDDSCSFMHPIFGVASPSIYQIIDYAYGLPKRNGAMETPDKFFDVNMNRLINCRMNGLPIPPDIATSIVNRASKLAVYPKSVDGDGKKKYMRDTLLFTACAIIRKKRHDWDKEEWDVALEKDKKDRSYQFGRLLAVLECAEERTYEKGKGRETNAIRFQSRFRAMPMFTSNVIISKLEQAYFRKLNEWQRRYYKKLIGEIMDKLSEFPDDELNKPLGETYLLGYYLQRNDIFTKKDNKAPEAAADATASESN